PARFRGTNRNRYTGRRRKISRRRFPGIYSQGLPCFVLMRRNKTVRRKARRRNGICFLPLSDTTLRLSRREGSGTDEKRNRQNGARISDRAGHLCSSRGRLLLFGPSFLA